VNKHQLLFKVDRDVIVTDSWDCSRNEWTTDPVVHRAREDIFEASQRRDDLFIRPIMRGERLSHSEEDMNCVQWTWETRETRRYTLAIDTFARSRGSRACEWSPVERSTHQEQPRLQWPRSSELTDRMMPLTLS